MELVSQLRDNDIVGIDTWTDGNTRALSEIAKELKTNTSCKKMRFGAKSKSTLTEDVIVVLADALEHNQSVTIFTVEYTKTIGERGIKALAKMLEARQKSTLPINDFRVGGQPFGSAGFKVLIGALAKCTSLKYFAVDKCKLTDADAAVLADGMCKNSKNGGVLKHVDFENNPGITTEGERKIVLAMLDAGIEPTNYTPDTAKAFLEQLKQGADKQLVSQLRENSIASIETWTDDYTRAVNEIAKELQANTSCKKIRLGPKVKGLTDETIVVLADALKHNRSVTMFTVENNGVVGHRGAKALAEMLTSRQQTTQPVTDFRVGGQPIGSAGFAGLADALAKCISLKYFAVDKCGLTDADAARLADGMRKNGKNGGVLKHVDFEKNPSITTEGERKIVLAMLEVEIEPNSYTPSTAKALLNELKGETGTTKTRDEMMTACDAIFDCYDEDGNGLLSLDEFTKIFTGLGMDKDEILIMLDAIDADKDGSIGRSEMLNWVFADRAGSVSMAPLKQVFDVETRGFSLKPVQDDAELHHLKAFFKVSDPHTLGKGRDYKSYPRPYSDLQVQHVWKIVSPLKQDIYSSKREEIKRQVRSVKHVMPDCTVSTKLDEAASLLGYNPVGVNQKLMLHGTKPETILTVMQNGLDERFCGGLFGKGIYTAEDPSKIDQYSTPDNGQDVDLMRILYDSFGIPHPGEIFYCFAVKLVFGCPIHTKDGETDCDNGKTVWATDDKRQLAAIPTTDPPVPYHSLICETGGKIKRHREFLVFNGEHTVPEYLIAYKRA